MQCLESCANGVGQKNLQFKSTYFLILFCYSLSRIYCQEYFGLVLLRSLLRWEKALFEFLKSSIIQTTTLSSADFGSCRLLSYLETVTTRKPKQYLIPHKLPLYILTYFNLETFHTQL